MDDILLKPLTTQEFDKKITTNKHEEEVDYLAYFQPYLEKIENFAIGPFFWFIPDNTKMKILAASENISQLTPYAEFTEDHWDITVVEDFANIIHPDDRNYVLSAIQIAMETIEITPSEKLQHLKFNIYGRFLDAHHHYRWALIQFPAFYVTERVDSVIVLVTDLSHLDMINAPLLTISDFSNKSFQYFKVLIDTRKLIAMDMPAITKREQEIIRLMAKGLNSPQIADFLNISYSTVENHKKNLRVKTKTKTSAELMNFVVRNNLS